MIKGEKNEYGIRKQSKITWRETKKTFRLNKSVDPVALSKKVFRLENKAHRLAEEYCNVYIDEKDLNKKIESIEKSLDKILGYKKKKIPVFINLDPRGYALKVDTSYPTYLPRDWGGYGLIAPDLRL